MDKCIVDETGKLHGRWLVIGPAPKPSHLRGAYWLCECQCPLKTRKVMRGGTLRGGLSLSCGCFRQEKASQIRNVDTPYSFLFYKYRLAASTRGIAFDITVDDIKRTVIQNCIYCGAKPSNTSKFLLRRHNFYYNGLDRVDNNKGYGPDNIVPCCCKCNLAKRQMSYSEFREWIMAVYQHVSTSPTLPLSIIHRD